MAKWLEAVRFNDQGLVAVTAVEATDGVVLMQAWMNREALEKTVACGEMIYYSRSRKRLWHKGEQSGHTQTLLALWLDCDGDALVAQVRQKAGIACHTGRKSCFYRKLSSDRRWVDTLPILKAAEKIYGR